jgi:membrane protein YqaA with SNARE-associated domain
VKIKFGNYEIALLVSVILLVLAERWAVTNSGLEAITTDFINAINVWAVRYGYLGALLVSCFGNITFVLVFPYTIVIFFLASIGLNPIALGIATGIGAELGEMSGYIFGRSGARTFNRIRPGATDDFKLLLSRRPRLMPIVLFLVSFLPIPADVAFIPLGVLRYNIWKLIWPSTLGKICAGLVIAFVGHSFFRLSMVTDYATSLRIALITFIIIAVMLYAMAKVPWRLLVERTVGINPKKRVK